MSSNNFCVLLLGVMLHITSSFADFSEPLSFMPQFGNSHTGKVEQQNHPSPPIVKVSHPEKNLKVPISTTKHQSCIPSPTPIPPLPTWTPPLKPIPPSTHIPAQLILTPPPILTLPPPSIYTLPLPPIWTPPRGLTLHDSSLNGLKDSSPPSENVQISSVSSAEIPMFQEQYKPKYEETTSHELIKKTLVHKK